MYEKNSRIKFNQAYSFFAYENFNRYHKSSWVLVALPLLFLFFSMDEIVQIHESIGSQTDSVLLENERKNTYFKHTGIWTILIGIPFILCFFLWSFTIRRYFPRNTASFKLFILGMTVFLIGALGIETLSNQYEIGSIDIVFCVAVEELMEMLGATIIFQSMYMIISDTLQKFIKLNTG